MKIVVGYVMSDEGEAALQWAIDRAAQEETEIIVVHSLKGGGSIETEEEEILAYRPKMDEIEARLTGLGIPHTTRRLIRGMSPSEDIALVAREHEAAMIVIGLRRRSRTGKLLMGSNAQEIILGAECPVVSVKAEYLKGR